MDAYRLLNGLFDKNCSARSKGTKYGNYFFIDERYELPSHKVSSSACEFDFIKEVMTSRIFKCLFRNKRLWIYVVLSESL
jgi:hypothetical protein